MVFITPMGQFGPIHLDRLTIIVHLVIHVLTTKIVLLSTVINQDKYVCPHVADMKIKGTIAWIVTVILIVTVHLSIVINTTVNKYM